MGRSGGGGGPMPPYGGYRSRGYEPSFRGGRGGGGPDYGYSSRKRVYNYNNYNNGLMY